MKSLGLKEPSLQDKIHLNYTIQILSFSNSKEASFLNLTSYAARNLEDRANIMGFVPVGQEATGIEAAPNKTERSNFIIGAAVYHAPQTLKSIDIAEIILLHLHSSEVGSMPFPFSFYSDDMLSHNSLWETFQDP